MFEAAVSQAGERGLAEGLRLVENAIDPGAFMLGESMSVADVYLAMFYAWYTGEGVFAEIERLSREVAEHRVIGPIWQRHFAG